MTPLRLIVGIGNPGSEYRATRHNAGAWFVERTAEIAIPLLSLQRLCCGCRLSHIGLRESKPADLAKQAVLFAFVHRLRG